MNQVFNDRTVVLTITGSGNIKDAAGIDMPSLSSCPFLDVNKLEYYCSPILWAYEQKITMGTDATHFSPEDTVTRGQFVTFLYRLLG